MVCRLASSGPALPAPGSLCPGRLACPLGLWARGLASGPLHLPFPLPTMLASRDSLPGLLQVLAWMLPSQEHLLPGLQQLRLRILSLSPSLLTLRFPHKPLSSRWPRVLSGWLTAVVQVADTMPVRQQLPGTWLTADWACVSSASCEASFHSGSHTAAGVCTSHFGTEYATSVLCHECVMPRARE